MNLQKFDILKISETSSKAVIHHIETKELRVQVYWVGDILEQVVDYLDSASLPFLVLHHTPSTLTLRYSMSPVMFPTCKDPLLRQGYLHWDEITNKHYREDTLGKDR